jgi:hypothetical protein
VIVDADEDDFVADPTIRTAPIAVDPMPNAVDAREALGIDVEQLARNRVLVVCENSADEKAECAQ